VNEQAAAIEREYRAFWSRMLRERFGQGVALGVDWEAFETASANAGWPLYPLNIQQAGIERLLYALTGLMDKSEEFKAAAVDRIHSIHITSAADINAVRLWFHNDCISYRCFAGDWNGYFTIEQMQQYLNDSIRGKSRVRKRLEGWLINLLSGDESEKDAEQRAPTVAPEEADDLELSEDEREEVTGESSRPLSHSAIRSVPPYDDALRAELESSYNAVIQALVERDREGLLKSAEVSRSDEETLRSEMKSDGFVSFSEWLLTVYPRLEETTLVSLKTEGENLAGYYSTWVPPYSDGYLNLTLLKFLRDGGQWKMLFRLTEMASAPVQVRKDEDTLAKVLEVMDTNPLMTLEHPGSVDASNDQVVEPKIPQRLVPLKEELEAIQSALAGSLEQRDIEAFLDTVILSREDEERLRKKFKTLSRDILRNTPDRSKATFIALKTIGRNKAGYYFVAPYPHNPSFKFVYLRPFVRRDRRWRMVFSLDHDLAVSLNIAKSTGDLVARAKEVIREIDLLHLDWAMTSLFEDIINRNS
jgi:hypothetical protein